MALPIPPINPNNPIPNNPFYSDPTTYFDGPYYPAIVDSYSGLVVNPDGTITVTGGGGGGVSTLTAGPGIALSGSTGAVTVSADFAAGTNIALTQIGNQLVISASGGGTGSVTAIAVGSGLTATSNPITTSGSISLNTACVIPPSAFAVKGDLLVGTGSGTYTALPTGTDGQVLLACSGSGATGLCWGGVGSVTSVTGTAPIAVATGTTTPVISIASSSTTAPGAVQLYDDVNSTSTTLALTAAQGKVLQDQIDALLITSNLTFAGTFDADAGVLLTVTSAGTAESFVIGSDLPNAAAGNLDFFVIVTTPGSYTPPGGSTPYEASQGDWFLSNGTSWQFLNVGSTPPDATPSVAGVIKGCTENLLCNTFLGCQVTPANPTGASNTAVGYNAGAALSSGNSNVAVGAEALCANDTGSSNSALGGGSLASNISGLSNTASGRNALFGNTSGSSNTGVGLNALDGNTTGCFNTAIGANAGSTLVGSSECNVIIGYNVQPLATTGNCQLAIGFGLGCYWLTGLSTKAIKPAAGIIDCANSCGTDRQALVSNGANAVCWSDMCATPICRGFVKGCTDTTNAALGCNALRVNVGVGNVAVGLDSLCTNTTGGVNVAVGLNSMRTNTVGTNNVAVGNRALCANTIGNGNVAIGTVALSSAVDASGTVAIGESALCAATTGLCNVALGASAGSNITTGSQNVIIGPNAAAPVVTGSRQLALGFSATDNWLTGCSDKSIRPGAGIRDCLGCVGTKGQVLTATGCALGSSVEWRNLPGCPVIRRSSQTSTFGAAFVPTTICYATAITDTTGWYNGTTGVFQPTIAGYYQISAMARTCTLTTGVGESVISIICNGTNIINVGSYGQINGAVNTLVCMNGTTDALCVQITAAGSGTGCTVTQPSSSRFTALLMALA